MSNLATRPWGILPWLLPKMSADQWTFWGCMATEERCLAAWQFLRDNFHLQTTKMIEIHDPPSQWSAVLAERINQRKTSFQSQGGNLTAIVKHDLLERTETMKLTADRIIEEIASSGGNVILDISCFPKRFFFPYVKMLLNNNQIKNLIITYTRPKTYGPAPLAEDVDTWQNLPMFGAPYPPPEKKVLIISLGFEPLSLPSLLAPDLHNTAIRLLFPFPPGPPFFQRTWEFMRQLEDKLPSAAKEPIRVSAVDTSDAFDHIRFMSENETLFVELAPYGPKPLSLAMCLYACSHPDRAAVFYTQPSVYCPDYSSGISHVNGQPEIYAYCVRLNSRDLYI